MVMIMVRGQVISGIIKFPYELKEHEIEDMNQFIEDLKLTLNKRIGELIECEFTNTTFQDKEVIGVDLKIVKSRRIEVDEIRKMIFSEIAKTIGKRVCVLVTTRIVSS